MGGSFAPIQEELEDEYLQTHTFPWIVGYSGGKDSTLVVHLVFEMLMKVPPSYRTRPVHIVANDTLVESPLILAHLTASLEQIENAAITFGLPITTKITQPLTDQSFWVNLIGRGYPSPNRAFRWCTSRMKISPTSRYILEHVDDSGEVILLLGVRRAESVKRSQTVARYDSGGRLHQHGDLPGCMVFRPIVELSNDEVWDFLGSNSPPWGGSHEKLIKLYRDAGGGECPVVTQKSDVPSCGSSSSRFGCWTCTVVEKDRSLEGFVESGFKEFGPLLDFRDWLVRIRNEPSRRKAERRNGRVAFTDAGKLIPGPYTLATRAEILEKLRAVEQKTQKNLIKDEEVYRIKELWAEEIIEQPGEPAAPQVKNVKKGVEL